jgi:hypothetical protein
MAQYDLIATGNFTSSASTYSLTGIPGGYTDCIIVISNFRANGFSAISASFNNNVNYDTYYSSYIMADFNSGSASMANTQRNDTGLFYLTLANGQASTSSTTFRIQVGRYASNTYKTFVGQGQTQNSAGTGFSTNSFGGTWVGTDAITSFQLLSGSNMSSAIIKVYGIINS